VATRLIFLVALLLWPTFAHAADVRAVVRRGSGTEAALKRLKGQLVDVEVEIVEVKGKLEPSLDEQVVAAAKLADKHEARAVLWFVPREDGLDVVVAQPDERRVFLRTIVGDDDSANAEAAALAGRSALRAIAEGGVIGVVTPVAAASEPPPRQVGDSESPFVRQPVPPRESKWRATGRLGWRLVGDGGAAAGAHELVGHVGVGGRQLTVELGLAVGPPQAADIADAEQVDVRLGRAAATLGVGWRSGRWGASLAAGSLVYQRSTAATGEDLTATAPKLIPTFLLAGEVRVRFALTPPASLELTAGLGAAFGAPELTVTRGDETRVIQTLWTIQPHIGLGLAFDAL
jgi:hypothetical protein